MTVTQPESDPALVHLIKLCVGITDIGQLEASVARRKRAGSKYWISTRLMPRRRDDLLAGGSLYWVIGGRIQARQRILAMDMGQTELGVRAIIELDLHVQPTEYVPRRPFQGWRYLSASDIPADIGVGGAQNLPTELENDIKAALAW